MATNQELENQKKNDRAQQAEIQTPKLSIDPNSVWGGAINPEDVIKNALDPDYWKGKDTALVDQEVNQALNAINQGDPERNYINWHRQQIQGNVFNQFLTGLAGGEGWMKALGQEEWAAPQPTSGWGIFARATGQLINFMAISKILGVLGKGIAFMGQAGKAAEGAAEGAQLVKAGEEIMKTGETVNFMKNLKAASKAAAQFALAAQIQNAPPPPEVDTKDWIDLRVKSLPKDVLMGYAFHYIGGWAPFKSPVLNVAARVGALEGAVRVLDGGSLPFSGDRHPAEDAFELGLNVLISLTGAKGEAANAVSKAVQDGEISPETGDRVIKQILALPEPKNLLKLGPLVSDLEASFNKLVSEGNAPEFISHNGKIVRVADVFPALHKLAEQKPGLYPEENPVVMGDIGVRDLLSTLQDIVSGGKEGGKGVTAESKKTTAKGETKTQKSSSTKTEKTVKTTTEVKRPEAQKPTEEQQILDNIEKSDNLEEQPQQGQPAPKTEPQKQEGKNITVTEAKEGKTEEQKILEGIKQSDELEGQTEENTGGKNGKKTKSRGRKAAPADNERRPVGRGTSGTTESGTAGKPGRDITVTGEPGAGGEPTGTEPAGRDITVTGESEPATNKRRGRPAGKTQRDNGRTAEPGRVSDTERRVEGQPANEEAGRAGGDNRNAGESITVRSAEQPQEEGKPAEPEQQPARKRGRPRKVTEEGSGEEVAVTEKKTPEEVKAEKEAELQRRREEAQKKIEEEKQRHAQEKQNIRQQRKQIFRDILDREYQRETKRNNDFFDDRAAAIKKQLEEGKISKAKASKELKRLEQRRAERQSQLDNMYQDQLHKLDNEYVSRRNKIVRAYNNAIEKAETPEQKGELRAKLRRHLDAFEKRWSSEHPEHARHLEEVNRELDKRLRQAEVTHKDELRRIREEGGLDRTPKEPGEGKRPAAKEEEEYTLPSSGEKKERNLGITPEERKKKWEDEQQQALGWLRGIETKGTKGETRSLGRKGIIPKTQTYEEWQKEGRPIPTKEESLPIERRITKRIEDGLAQYKVVTTRPRKVLTKIAKKAVQEIFQEYGIKLSDSQAAKIVRHLGGAHEVSSFSLLLRSPSGGNKWIRVPLGSITNNGGLAGKVQAALVSLFNTRDIKVVRSVNRAIMVGAVDSPETLFGNLVRFMAADNASTVNIAQFLSKVLHMPAGEVLQKVRDGELKYISLTAQDHILKGQLTSLLKDAATKRMGEALPVGENEFLGLSPSEVTGELERIGAKQDEMMQGMEGASGLSQYVEAGGAENLRVIQEMNKRLEEDRPLKEREIDDIFDRMQTLFADSEIPFGEITKLVNQIANRKAWDPKGTDQLLNKLNILSDNLSKIVEGWMKDETLAKDPHNQAIMKQVTALSVLTQQALRTVKGEANALGAKKYPKPIREALDNLDFAFVNSGGKIQIEGVSIENTADFYTALFKAFERRINQKWARNPETLTATEFLRNLNDRTPSEHIGNFVANTLQKLRAGTIDSAQAVRLLAQLSPKQLGEQLSLFSAEEAKTILKSAYERWANNADLNDTLQRYISNKLTLEQAARKLANVDDLERYKKVFINRGAGQLYDAAMANKEEAVKWGMSKLDDMKNGKLARSEFIRKLGKNEKLGDIIAGFEKAGLTQDPEVASALKEAVNIKSKSDRVKRAINDYRSGKIDKDTLTQRLQNISTLSKFRDFFRKDPELDEVYKSVMSKEPATKNSPAITVHIDPVEAEGVKNLDGTISVTDIGDAIKANTAPKKAVGGFDEDLATVQDVIVKQASGKMTYDEALNTLSEIPDLSRFADWVKERGGSKAFKDALIRQEAEAETGNTGSSNFGASGVEAQAFVNEKYGESEDVGAGKRPSRGRGVKLGFLGGGYIDDLLERIGERLKGGKGVFKTSDGKGVDILYMETPKPGDSPREATRKMNEARLAVAWEGLKNIYHHFVYHVQDFTHPIYELTRKVLKDFDKESAAKLFKEWTDNPQKVLDWWGNRYGVIRSWINDVPTDFFTLQPIKDVLPLDEIYRGLNHQEMLDFSKYQIYRRYLGEIDDLGKNPAKVLAMYGAEPGVVSKTVEEIRRYVNTNRARFEDRAREFTKWNNAIVDQLVKAGVVDKEFGESLKQRGFYSPLFRHFDVMAQNGMVDPRLDNVKTPLMKFEGSNLPVMLPYAAAIKLLLKSSDAITRNTLMRAIAGLKDIKGGEKLVKELTEKPKGKALPPNVIAVREGENYKYYEVPADVARAIRQFDSMKLNGFTKRLLDVAAMPARVMRTGVTASLEFASRNIFRDMWMAALTSDTGFNPLTHIPRSFLSAINKDEYYHEFLRSGMGLASLAKVGELSLDKIYENVNKKGLGLNPINYLESLSDFMEQLTRRAIFISARQKGLSIAEASIRARQGTVDFSKVGASMKYIAPLVAFLNPRIQGATRLLHQFKEKPVQTMLRGAAMFTLPSIILYALNRNNPNYFNQPMWMRNSFWLIPIPGTDRFVPLPKGEVGMLFGSPTERMLEFLDQKDKRSMDKLMGDLWKNIMPVGSLDDFTPTIAKPLIENFANKSFFTGTKIVPTSRTALTPGLQYGLGTSQGAINIGKTIGVSPAQIENIARGWGGTMGRYGLEAIGLITSPKTALRTMEFRSEARDIPGASAFISGRPYGFYSEPVNRIQDLYEQASQYYNSVKTAVTPGERLRMLKNSDTLQNLVLYQKLKPIMTQLNRLQHQSIVIRKYAEEGLIPVDKAREVVRELERKATTYATVGLKVVGGM